MQKLIDILKVAALASGVIVAAFVCLLLFQVSAAVQSGRQQIAGVAGAATDTLREYQQLGVKVGTTVDGAGKLVNDSRYSVSEVNRNVLAERKMYEQAFPSLLAHADGVLTGLDTDTADAHGLIVQATARTQELAALEASLTSATNDFDRTGTAALQHFSDTVAQADTLLRDPSIPLTMKNVAGMTTTGNHMLFTFDAVETKATHDYLHPSKNPLVRTWRFAEPFLIPGAQIAGAIAAK